MIGVVGYGMGNIRSMMNALSFAGVDAELISEPARLRNADKIILPGVGAFGRAMKQLEETGFRAALDETVLERSRPILGVCVGMQLLATYSSEFGRFDGLGYIAGTVDRIEGDTTLRLPHMGWNDLEIHRSCRLLDDLEPGACCYFVHSYQLRPDDASDLVATTDYGGPVTAVVEHDHVFGAQFHPEKSQDVGMALLQNFDRL